MKKLFLSIGLFSVVATKAQTFVSFTTTTKNAGLSIGYLEEASGIELSTGYNVPVLRNDRPWLFSLTLGKRVLLSQNETDNFSITPSIGYALYSVKDFSAYENDKEGGDIKQVKEIRPFYKLELGKDWYLGRLFISANYCKRPFYGVGIRAFIK